MVLLRFKALVAERPDDIVLSEAGISVSYRDLDRRSSALAHILHDLGLGPEDVFAFIRTEMSEVLTAMLAGLKAGCGFVLPDAAEEPTKLRHLLDQARVSVCCASGPIGQQALSAIDREARLVAPADLDRDTPVLPDPPDTAIAFVEPTSGSTGMPKLVYSSQATVGFFAGLQLDHSGIGPADKVGMLGEIWIDTVMAALLSGAQLHAFDFRSHGAAALSDWIRSERITAVQTYVAAFRALEEATAEPLPDLKIVRLSGEAVLRRDVEAFQRICPEGAVLTNFFGATECGFVAAHRHRWGDPLPEGALPVGQPPPGAELRVVDEYGLLMPDGAIGMLEFVAPHLPEGYLHNPERTAEVYATDPSGRRVLRSGDMGYRGEDGLFRMAGRSDDQVKIRGYSVRYSDVETAIEALDGVAEAAVTSVVSPRGVRQLVAHLLLEEGAEASSASIRAGLQATVPNYMVPPHVMFPATLPRTGTGKILRRALPDPLEESQTVSWEGLTPDQRAVAEVWSDILGHRNFGLDEDFFDVGGDSLQAMSVVVTLERKLKLRVGYESLIMKGASLRSIASRLTPPEDAGVVTLSDEGTGRPLYVMPVENGEFSDWLYLLNAFEPVRPMLGVHARPQDQRAVFPYRTVEQLAAHVVGNIVRHDPDGPHLIAGFSSGAQLGYEVARQLEARGIVPAGLVLLDPPVPSFEPERRSWHIRRIFSPIMKRRDIAAAWDRAKHILLRRPTRELAIADESCFWRHRPSGQTTAPTLYLSAIDLNPRKAEKEALWSPRFAGELQITDVTGDHITLVREPHSARLAKMIERWVDRISPP